MSQYMDKLARSIGFDSYSRYLDSKHWKSFSNKARKTRCFCCLSDRNLHVHHITYERLGKEWLTDVVTVCSECHTTIHKMVKGRVALGIAHFRLKIRIDKERRHRKWVLQENLCNPAFRETVDDVVSFLLDEGYVYEDGSTPTPLAFQRQFARIA